MQKKLNIEKIAFTVVQIKFLAMHITYKKFSFDIFMVGNSQNIFMEHDLYVISELYYTVYIYIINKNDVCVYLLIL